MQTNQNKKKIKGTKETVSDAGSAISGVFIILAFTEGAAVMALELLGSRMIAPVYGSSLTVWTTVLGVTMAALALGYLIGGKIALKNRAMEVLHLLFLFAAFLIVIMPQIAILTNDLLSDTSLGISVFVSALLFLFIPVSVLGATTPILVRAGVENGLTQGQASGRVFGASTIGGIVFTFIVGFWLVPDLGLSKTAFVTTIIISIIPLFSLIKLRKKKYIFLFVFYLVCGLIVNTSGNNKPSGIKIIHQSEGLLGQLLVVDQLRDDKSGSNRILFVNRMGQTWIDKTSGNSIWTYPNYLAVLASSLKERSDVLLLGVGGGTVANILHNTAGMNVEAVELDERIGQIARSNFNLSKNISVTIDDARHFIRTTPKKYDLIIFDVFKGEVPPAHVLTVECFRNLNKNLKENGFVIINFNGFVEGEEGKAGRAIMKTLLAAGYQLKLIPTYGEASERNILYVASVKPLDFSNTRIKLNLFNKPVNIDSLQLPIESVRFQPEDKILSDDYPILDILNTDAAKVWRKAYNDGYTKKYSENGIPIFK